MGEGRADALRPGHRLHVYGIAEVLGAGGFGITYRAEEEFTHRQVAIKEFLPNSFAFRASDGVGVRPISEGAGTDFAWGLERFRLEAKTLYSLRHPNIVPVLQYFEANGTGYLVMEYQAGATLGALLKRDITLDPAELDEILEQLLDGLAAVHANGFLHRDVKPDNIFIRSDGVPLLLDFGAARQAIGARSQSLTTIISEGYAPFEQYESSGNQGPWTDLYAFGATLYRCMTGLKPIPAPSRVMAQMQGARDPLAQVPVEARERYGAELVGAVEAAMRVNATARPQTIEAFRALVRDGARTAVPAAETSVAAETLVAAEPAGTIALPNSTPPPRAPAPMRPTPPPRPTPPAPPVRQRPRRNDPVLPPAEPVAATEPPPRGRAILWITLIALAAAGAVSLALVAADSGSPIGFAVVGTAIVLHGPFAAGAIARRAWASTTLALLMLMHVFPAVLVAGLLSKWLPIDSAREYAAAALVIALVITTTLGIVILIADARARRRARAAGVLAPAGNGRRGFWLYLGCCIAAAAAVLFGFVTVYGAGFDRADQGTLAWIAGVWAAFVAPLLAAAAFGQRWAAIAAGAIMVSLFVVIPLVGGQLADVSSLYHAQRHGDHIRLQHLSAALAGGAAFLLGAIFGLVLWYSRDLRAWQQSRRVGRHGQGAASTPS